MLQSKINGVPVSLQHDSGAACTVINKQVWIKLGKPKLVPAKLALRSYNSNIPVLGQCKVMVKLEGQEKLAWLVVVKHGELLLGRNWIKLFNIRIEDKLHGSCNHMHGIFMQGKVKPGVISESELTSLAEFIRSNRKAESFVCKTLKKINTAIQEGQKNLGKSELDQLNVNPKNYIKAREETLETLGGLRKQGKIARNALRLLHSNK